MWRRRLQKTFAPTLAVLLSLCVFLPGLAWGLPSRADDRFLFGDREPWTGEQIIALSGGFDVGAGSADQDQTTTAGGPFVNANDADRAQIVRRYRLYSHHPDEMLTFRALAAMAGNRSADPRFYTYGGLWIYPVGALIGAAAAVEWIEVGNLAFYLDHPEQFARFYLVGRAYAVAWAAVGAAIVCVLVRRITRSNLIGVAAAVTYALLPVVVVAAHEAKPHLPGAVLALWSVLPADTYVRTGRRKHLLWSGLLCGAATGMAVTMAVSFIILPLAWWMRGRRKPRVNDPQVRTHPHRPPSGGSLTRGSRLVGTSIALGVLVFVVTNPFVPINLLTDPSALFGNAETTAGHYRVGIEGLGWAWHLTREAMTTPMAVSAMLAATIGLALAPRWHISARAVVLLIVVSAGLAWIGFALTASGRPADHARFALLPSIAGAPLLFIVCDRLFRRTKPQEWRLVLPMLPALPLVFWAWLYVSEFRRDAGPDDSRTRAAERFAAESGGGVLSLTRDPAPYSTPPFDLWRWNAKVEDLRTGAEDAVLVELRDELTPISWADVPFAFAVHDAKQKPGR